MANIKKDATVGRLLLMDSANLPNLTAEEFMSYINEGLVPVFYSNSSGTVYKFASWSTAPSGAVSLSMDEQTMAIFFPTDYVPNGNGPFNPFN